MTDPPFPSFSSFPGLATSSKAADKDKAMEMAMTMTTAPATASAPAAPSFSSFPGIAPTKREREREREGERRKEKERERDGRGDRERRMERDGARENKERESRRDRDPDRDRDSTRDRDRDKDRENKRALDRHRERDKEHVSDRDRDRNRNHEPKERRKDDDPHRDRRRDRDRDRDRDRVRDRDRDRPHHRDERPRERDRDERRKEIEDRRERERRSAAELAQRPAAEETKRGREEDGGDDGVAWYEAGGGSSAKRSRGAYQAPFDPAAPSVAFVDTVGDKDVLLYGATSSFSAPRYRRDKGGRVLGLSDALRVVHVKERTRKGIEIAPLGRPYIPRYSSRAIDDTSSRHLARILMRPGGGAGSDLSESFTPFDVPRLIAARTEDDLPAYRAITREAESDEEEMEAIQAALGKVSTLEEEVRSRTAAYERDLRAEPTDIDKWIAYSKLHLELSDATSSAHVHVDPVTQPTNRANAEVTLSILARALEHEANLTSTTLHVAYLRAAEGFWPAAKVTERWQNVIRTLGDRTAEEDMMGLYLGYIEWREGQGIGQTTEGSTGGVDEVVDVYLECLYRLNTGEVRDQEAREENQVYLVLRACLFLKQAGFTERALAVFQALLEVTFFKPGYLRQPAPPFDREMWFGGVLQEFEDFWDSEVPRFGEPGALGWATAHSSRTVGAFAATPASQGAPTSADPHTAWAEAEEHASKSLRLPGRVTDLDAPDDDPFHFVIFSDVRPFLFPLQTPGARLQLIYAFLNFLGLPFSPPDVPTTSAPSTDPHLRWTIGENGTLRAAFWPAKPGTKRIAWQTVDGEPMEPERPRSLTSPFTSPVKAWMADWGTLFGRGWFRDIGAADLLHVDVEYARNALTLLRPLVPDPSFVLSTFAFEAALSPKAAIKLAKTVLSDDRDNLSLWDGYARLERQRGKIQAARQVYVTALQAAGQRERTADAKMEENTLWASWAEMEFSEGEEERCLEVLVMAAGSGLSVSCAEAGHVPSRPSAVALLKAKQHYATTPDSATLALATLYTTLTESIQAARDRLLSVIASLPADDPQTEEALQLLCKVLYTYGTRHSMPATIARDVLEKAVDMFPNNTAFLSLYLFGEVGGRVYGRVHRLVNKLTASKGGGGAVALLWSVWAEAVSAGSNFWYGGGERVRRALDRGITSDIGKKSPTLWTLYIEFELHQSKPAAAKALLYRALAHNGAAKALYLLAFAPPLRGVFSSRELRALGELMAERGVRMRVHTEAFWEDVDTEDEDEDEDEEQEGEQERGDYEYGLLREREVLKPY